LLAPAKSATNANIDEPACTVQSSQQITCIECNLPFTFEQGEHEFWVSKGWEDPVRCKKCRIAKKERMGGSKKAGKKALDKRRAKKAVLPPTAMPDVIGEILLGADGEPDVGNMHVDDYGLQTPMEVSEGGYPLDWIRIQLEAMPSYETFPGIMREAVQALGRWRDTLDKELWIRVMRRNRVLKEINEYAPVIDRARRFVENIELPPGEKVTIVDLCSGFGYLSMFLSEMLPADKIARCVLVDNSWPERGAQEFKPHHINPRHLTQAAGKWKIPLHVKKVDLKKGRSLENMHEQVFAKAPGPVLMLAVHLCGTLSLRAIEMFNRDPHIAMLVLKPCCLPGLMHLRRECEYHVGEHIFTAADIYIGKNADKHVGKHRFNAWCDNLRKGVVDSKCSEVTQESIQIQRRHWQNKFIFATREWGPETLTNAKAQHVTVKDAEFGEARCTVEKSVRKRHEREKTNASENTPVISVAS